ncbi:MAG TPA: PIN domain-containing protein [Vicinamibacterales bacterium]|nr:PIN domain-containing protein [Vicinamibacterales bacterium]
MTVVLDAYALIAALVGERARADVEPLIAEGVLAAPNAAEVLDVCVRVHGNAERIVRERLGWLVAGGLELAPLGPELALAAGALRARYYRRRQCEISQGDCFALALAADRQLPLATSDPDLASVARAEKVKVIGLPDSRGRRP